MIGYIYMLTSPRGKRYVGQTNDIQRRGREFFDTARMYSAGGKIDIERSQFPPSTWTREILTTIDVPETTYQKAIDKLESYYVALYNTYRCGLNSTKGGKVKPKKKRSKKWIQKRCSS